MRSPNGVVGTGFMSTAIEPLSAPKFHSLGLNDELLAAVEKEGYKTPTPIQSKTIPLLLEGRDVLGQAQTGTGKTAAFALPILQRLDRKVKQPQVLVLAPTRELAIQVAEAFKTYGQGMPSLTVLPIYGGQDYEVQFRQLKRGAQVVVGTPGRVMDHMRRGTLKLDSLQCVVLDEADEMLRMGFAEDVDWVLSHVPNQRQMALFSATMPAPIREIARKHLNDPAEITIAAKQATAKTVRQRYLIAAPHQKEAVLERVLDAQSRDGVLIFVKTRTTTETLAERLSQRGFKAAALSGDVVQKQRERIVERFKSGRLDIIVATDVAARGLDVDRISHVINYELPHDREAYIHRIGRTGRAGREGDAILFLHPRERRALERLQRETRQTIEPMDLPSNRSINKSRVARFHDKITAALGSKELETYQAIIEHYVRDNDVPVEMIAAALATMANADHPLLVKQELKQAEFVGNASAKRSDYRSRTTKRDFKKDRSRPRRSDDDMETYRIEVGRAHQVQPGNIVGAIANEVGIGGESIGRIQIHDRYSSIDLPKGLPNDVVDALKTVCVGGRPLRISRFKGGTRRPTKTGGSKRSFKPGKGKFKGKKAAAG